MLYMGKDVKSVGFYLSAFPILICWQVSAQCISISSFLQVDEDCFEITKIGDKYIVYQIYIFTFRVCSVSIFKVHCVF